MNNITAADFSAQGEQDFKAGKYQAAGRNFRHALVDDPTNAGALMLLGQTAFALGQFNEAAGATEMAMKGLPQEKWGSVVTNYAQLYGNAQDYTDHLRALEKARNEKPDDPAARFLLGFHYYYLGHTKEAFRELDKAINLSPRIRSPARCGTWPPKVGAALGRSTGRRWRPKRACAARRASRRTRAVDTLAARLGVAC